MSKQIRVEGPHGCLLALAILALSMAAAVASIGLLIRAWQWAF